MLLDGHEEYELLALAMRDFWASVERLRDTGLQVEGRSGTCPVHFNFGGDLKFVWTQLSRHGAGPKLPQSMPFL